jgi:hypothetical protein
LIEPIKDRWNIDHTDLPVSKDSGTCCALLTLIPI